MKVGLVNNGIGNIGSIYSAFKLLKFDIHYATKPEDMDTFDVIILAGVGSFKTSVSRLKKIGFWDKLNDEVLIKKKPVLGICLGMQLFADVSYEDGVTEGFGWIKGKVVKMEGDSLRLPHIGWNEVINNNEKLFHQIKSNNYYFMHSYSFVPAEKNVIHAITKYGDWEIASTIVKGNIFGVQFHPEKSQADGLRFFRNFMNIIS